MHEQRGSFQGIDTCDITDFGKFSFCSLLLDESESRSIANRPDINSLLDNLKNDGLLTSETVDGIRKRSRNNCPSDEVMEKCLEGSTYVGLEDSMQMQHEIVEGNFIEVTINDDTSSDIQVIITKRNWEKTMNPQSGNIKNHHQV